MQKDGRTWVAAAPIAWSFMFSSLSPLHLRAWMHVSSQGVWNGETQTCDVHSCSLLFLPCISEHGCTSHHRESGMVRPRHVRFIHVLFKKELTCDFSPSTRMLAAGRFCKFGQKRINSRFYSFHGAVPMQ